ncbi:MAG: glycosyl transferase, partial [Methanocalculus sp.]|nr:glycosyl transferase [Methanocalculus sp.]
MGKKIRSEKRSANTQQNNSPPQTPSSLKDTLLSSRPLQLVLLLTIAGLFLRLYQLGFNSLWLDEASTLGFARHSLAEIWGFTASGEFNPPLFYWMEHIMLIFGESEVV